MEKGLFKVSVLQIIYVILYVVLVALYNAFKIDISFSKYLLICTLNKANSNI